MNYRGVIATATVGLSLLAAGAGLERHHHASACPSGFVQREVRAYGQRLESDPRPSLNPVLTQNDWEDTQDHRFVVTLACVRPLNNAENDELFKWGSKH